MTTSAPQSRAATGQQDSASTTGKHTPDNLTIIGIGASAGGLTSLRTFFSALPPDTGMTFVVIVHLSPDHASHLPELLSDYTRMPVTQVQGKVAMEPNHVYVIPPAKRLLVTGSHLDLEELEQRMGRRLQIDTFFRTLAETHGDGAAIILSGTGSDGAVGMRAVKEQGGLLLVQSPEEAEYDGMPKSAIATGLVDVVAPVADLAAQLVAAKRTKATLELPEDPHKLSQREQQTVVQILTQLRLRTGHDFSGYREATVLRRIARRMQLVQLTTLDDYLNRLRQDGDEIDALYRDVLIHVTEFFRDPAAWAALAKEIVPQLFEGKTATDAVRVWTVGCATGEEAYGLAMLLLEYASQLDNPPSIQIFASDLGKIALDFARKGIYPEPIAADVPEARLARFFTHENSHYHVRAEVRELVLFTPHNLLQDPPFSKLDLIICRNVLIYLQRPLQERVFESFHYALRPGGCLFLGSAESTAGIHDLLDTVDKRHRLYRRSRPQGKTVILPTLPMLPRAGQDLLQSEAAQRLPSAEEQHRLLLEELGLPGLLVDEHFRVLHYSETAGRYLSHPAGPPTHDLLRLVRPELQSELRQVLQRALSQQVNAQTPSVSVQFDGVEHSVTVLVRPAPRQGRALVLFWEHDESPATAQNGAAANGQDGRAALFEAQLLLSEQQLQSSKEQYESSVEELSAANEELQSTNEEYRSTLEELETSKEELQSINEELQSVNQELKVRVEEIATANSDLQNLFAATEIATLFLDRDLCVKRYTPRAAELFNLMPSDQRRPIWHLRSKLDYPTLDVDVRRVLSTLIPLEHKILAEDQRWFLVGLRPYRTVEDRIDGVVITCVDITADKANELELRRREEQYRSLFESIDEGFCRIEVIFDAHDRPVNYRFLEVNPAFERNTGLHEATGRTMRELAPDHEQHWFDIYGDIALTGESRRFQNQAAALGRWYDVYAFRFGEPERRQVAVLFRDVTERHEMEEQLETKVVERTAQVRTLVTQLTVSEQEERRRISAILHDDLQQRLFSLNVQLAMLRQMLDANELGNARQVIDEIGGALRESVKVTRSLSVSLSPPVLHDEGLFEAVRWLASLMQQQHGLTVAVKAEQPLPPLGEDLRVLLFQLVRELLFNVVKHAGVAEATVSLAREDNHLRITVSDHGNGFDPGTGVAQINSQGLPRAERRLHLIGGRVQIQSNPGQGTCVTIYVPQPHEDEQ